MNKKMIIALIIIPIIIISIFILSDTFKKTSNKDKVIIVGGNFYPDIYKDENNKLDGFLYDLSKTIVENLGLEYEIVSTNWEKAIVMMEKEEADILLGASYSEPREEFLYYEENQINWKPGNKFPDETIKLGQYRFFTQKENSEKYNNWTYEELRNSETRIGSVAGTSIMDTLSKENQNIYSFKESKQGLDLLSQGSVDLFVGVNIGTEIEISKYNLTDKITMIDKPLTEKPYYILFSKSSERGDLKVIRENFYKELIRLKETGEFQNIYRSELEKHGIINPEISF